MAEKSNYKDLDRKAIKLCKQSIRMCTAAGSGHPSSALSLAHIVTALMYRVMRYDPQNPWNNAADRLVLSEGHAVPIIYAAYCDLGGYVGTAQKPSQLRDEDVLTLREAESVLDGHPNPAIGFPFFDAATGSLGMGLSVAAGLSGAAGLDERDRKIYCIIGDAESREGQIWEAVDFIVDHKLTGVRMIFNCNNQGQSDYVSPQQSAETLAAKLTAFHCEVRIIDGHNWSELLEALTAPATDQPLAVVAKTVKGWGSKELASKNYHGKPLDAELVEQALAELDEIAGKLGVAGDKPVALKLTIPEPVAQVDKGPLRAGSFAEALQAAGLEKPLKAKKLATRRAYGVALAVLGGDERIVALDGDVRGSTFANLFCEKYPARYFEGRIAEQNMVSAAVGFAAAGKIPFVSTFGKFFIRAYDQIELAAITEANIKLCGSHTGVSLAADGPSQMALPDLAFMRAFTHTKRSDGAPGIRVFLPSDAVSTFKLTELMANVDGLCYMRTHRPEVDFLYDPDETFELEGFKELLKGEDLAIVASGYMVHVAKEAAGILEKKAGLSVTLIDAYSLPLNAQAILKIGDRCRGQILVVEDNYIGGIADEITAAAAASDMGVSVNSLYVQRFPKSARTPAEILKMVHLSPTDIVNAAQQMFDQSS